MDNGNNSSELIEEQEEKTITILYDSDNISIKEIKNYFNQYFNYIRNRLLAETEQHRKWYIKKEIKRIKSIIDRVKLREIAKFKEIETSITCMQDKVNYIQLLLAKLDKKLLNSQEQVK